MFNLAKCNVVMDLACGSITSAHGQEATSSHSPEPTVLIGVLVLLVVFMVVVKVFK